MAIPDIFCCEMPHNCIRPTILCKYAVLRGGIDPQVAMAKEVRKKEKPSPDGTGSPLPPDSFEKEEDVLLPSLPRIGVTPTDDA